MKNGLVEFEYGSCGVPHCTFHTGIFVPCSREFDKLVLTMLVEVRGNHG